jgi:hypothetical protein
MAITKADVLARFAEFATIQDPEWTAVIGDASLSVNATLYGSKADLANIYLTAHLLGVAHPSMVPTGRVTSESMDGTSYRYAVADHAVAGDDLDTTPYGRLFKALRAQVRAGRGFVA